MDRIYILQIADNVNKVFKKFDSVLIFEKAQKPLSVKPILISETSALEIV